MEQDRGMYRERVRHMIHAARGLETAWKTIGGEDGTAVTLTDISTLLEAEKKVVSLEILNGVKRHFAPPIELMQQISLETSEGKEHAKMYFERERYRMLIASAGVHILESNEVPGFHRFVKSAQDFDRRITVCEIARGLL